MQTSRTSSMQHCTFSGSSSYDSAAANQSHLQLPSSRPASRTSKAFCKRVVIWNQHRDFMKTARRLTILMDLSSDNVGV
ncbi:hypothetical protein ACOSQ2_010543 [Xanthoceras sorbifolium]